MAYIKVKFDKHKRLLDLAMYDTTVYEQFRLVRLPYRIKF